MRITAQVVNGELRYTSLRSKDMFMEKAKGKHVIISIDDEATANKRRYFEGALVPAVYYQNPRSGWVDFKECREALKLEFLPGWTKTSKGERIKYARSTAELSNEKFGELLAIITRWMEEQQYEVPDPEEYKTWRDSAPPPGEVYPQLARLKQKYAEAI